MFYVSDAKSDNFLAKGTYTNKNGTKVREKVGIFIPRTNKITEIRKSQKCNANGGKKRVF